LPVQKRRPCSYASSPAAEKYSPGPLRPPLPEGRYEVVK
jgi:hypothetical protein